MSIAFAQLQSTAPQETSCFRLWGLSSVELHDAFWSGRGVCVARPGAAVAAQEEAGLFLLLGKGDMVLLDFPKVLTAMGWMSPQVCFIRPRDVRDVRADGPVRCAFTASKDVAARWSEDAGDFAAWKRLKSSIGGCASFMRATGRLYREGDGQALLERLARNWSDPTESVPGLKKVAPGVFAMDAVGNGSVAGGRRRRIWLGKGRSLSEVNGASVSVLSDRPQI